MTKQSMRSNQRYKRRALRRGLSIAVIVGIVVVVAIAANMYWPRSQSISQGQEVTQLKIEDLVIGTGAEAKVNDKVRVHYTGWLADGTKFDSSLDRNEPFEFVLGKGEVIEGWEKGVLGMKVGGKRRLIIPPQMAYGKRGVSGMIPPNATLTFEVELLAVNP